MCWRQSSSLTRGASWCYKAGWEVGIGHRWGHLTPLHNMIHGSVMYTTHVSLLACSHVTHTHVQAHTGDTYVHTRRDEQQASPCNVLYLYHLMFPILLETPPHNMDQCVKSIDNIPIVKTYHRLKLHRHLQAWSNNICTCSCFKENKNFNNFG